MNAASDFFRSRLLPCLLALALVGMGPAALASLPRSMNPGAEEETRTAAEHAVNGVHSAAERPRRDASGRPRDLQSTARKVSVSARRSVLESRIAPVSLRTLEVRCQV